MQPAQEPQESEATGVRALFAKNWFRVLIVVMAAAIVFGAWMFAERTQGDSPGDEDAFEVTLDDEYEEARRAAEQGDTEHAIEILERILAEEPADERAAVLLRQLRDEQAASGAGGQGGEAQPQPPAGGEQPQEPADGGQPQEPAAPGERPVADSVLGAPVGDIATLLPQVIKGWQRGAPVADDVSATVAFLSADSGAVGRTLYTVLDRGSADGARAFIANTSKVAYSKDGATVRIGREDGYFGTDGKDLATAVFTRGRFVFETTVTVQEGGPASAKAATIALAKEFEASR
jgi:hypothetical protein